MYVVGDHNAEDLGVISFQPEGGDPHQNGREKDEKNVSIPARHRKAGKETINKRHPCTGSQTGRTGREWTGTEDRSSQKRSGR